MKFKIFLLIVLFSSNLLYAQTKKGNILVSGSTGLQLLNSNIKTSYNGKTTKTVTQNTLTILPSAAYFLIDNLAIGLAGNYTNTSNIYTTGNIESSISTLLIPVAIFFLPIEGKIKPFAQIGAGIMNFTDKSIPKTGSNHVTSFSGICLNSGAGLAYFLKENISFNFGLSYTNSNLTNVDDDKSKLKQGNFGSNIGISIFF